MSCQERLSWEMLTTTLWILPQPCCIFQPLLKVVSSSKGTLPIAWVSLKLWNTTQPYLSWGAMPLTVQSTRSTARFTCGMMNGDDVILGSSDCCNSDTNYAACQCTSRSLTNCICRLNGQLRLWKSFTDVYLGTLCCWSCSSRYPDHCQPMNCSLESGIQSVQGSHESIFFRW